MSGWRDVTLGDLVVSAGGVIRTGPFGSQLHAHEYTEDPLGIPVVMPKDMIAGRVNRQSVSRVSEEIAERLSTHRLAAGDLVLARRGDVGRFAFIEDDEAGWLCGTGSMRVHAPDQRVVSPRYLRYAIADPAVTEWLVGRAVGATMPNLNDGIVSGIPVRVPDLKSQRRIAAVLGAFDELIEINERRIDLLENLARSLYREWFVRFRHPDGERGKAGVIPAGWAERPASEVIVINPRVQAHRTMLPKVTMGDVSEHVSTVFPSDVVSRPMGSRFQRDDVLFARITPCLENGKTALVKFLDLGDVAVGSTEFIVLRGATVGPAFTYCAARSEPLREHAIKTMSGASGRQRVAANCFDSVALAEPPAAIAAAFEKAAGPMLEEVFALASLNRRLAATRDLLLPRLVTGHLDISDVDLGALLPEAED